MQVCFTEAFVGMESVWKNDFQLAPDETWSVCVYLPRKQSEQQ